MPDLCQKAGLDEDSTWREWAIAAECEKQFPSDRRLTMFQQILIVQALRPDRLPMAMREFACRVLNLKDISPETTSIRYVYETETVASEPILIIISPGSDPSEELRELAETVVGKQSYHEVTLFAISRHAYSTRLHICHVTIQDCYGTRTNGECYRYTQKKHHKWWLAVLEEYSLSCIVVACFRKSSFLIDKTTSES